VLTEKQQIVFDKFLYSIKQKENYLLLSEDRNIGKTFVLNELAFTLQALGYIVFILTPYKNQEYFANKFVSFDDVDYYCRGLRKDLVIIADEAKFEMMDEFLNYCKYNKIPVIGYVNVRRNKIIEPT